MKTLLLLLLFGATAFAGEETATHRVTGLFSPDREAALGAALTKVSGVTLVSLDYKHAEAVFRYDPAVAFPGTKPEQIEKRFDELLRNASHSTFGIRPLIATPKEKLTSVEIAVAGLDCKACALAAYEAIAKLDGVAAATVNFKSGKVNALLEPGKTNRAALEGALKERGVAIKAR